MLKHTLAYTVTRRAYLDGMAEGVGRGALGYAEDIAGEYAAANAESVLDAAPDLLAALDRLVSIVEDHVGYPTGAAAVQDARAAIAKARGTA